MFPPLYTIKKNTHSCQKVQLNSMIEKKSKISSLKLIHFHQWKSTRPNTSFLRRFMAESLRSGIFKVWKLRLISETMHTMGANNINILKKTTFELEINENVIWDVINNSEQKFQVRGCSPLILTPLSAVLLHSITEFKHWYFTLKWSLFKHLFS